MVVADNECVQWRGKMEVGNTYYQPNGWLRWASVPRPKRQRW